jgi:DNA-binding transcriptional LysR family regulator
VPDVPPTAPKIGFRDLECLLVLVEELHFGRAAQRLGITQSSVARTIRRLEAELDVPLITRRSPAITPTAAGRRLADHVRPRLGGLALATAEARRAAGVVAPLRIGCVPDLALQHLQGFLGALHPRRPELELDVAYLRTAEQIRRLRTAQLDLALIRHAGEAEAIDVQPMFRGEPLAAFLPLGHRLEAKDSVAPGDLSDDVLLVTPREADPTLDDRVMTLLAAAGHRFRDVRETTGEDARSLLFAVAERHCAAIVPISALEVLGDVVSLVTARRLEPVVRMPDAALAWRVNPPSELHAIVSSAREVATHLYAQQSDEA